MDGTVTGHRPARHEQCVPRW